MSRASKKGNNDYQKKWQKRLRGLAAQAKLGRSCAECDYAENADALQWDHIEPRKNGRKWMGPKTLTQLQELIDDPNVQVLCANCHAIKSNSERRTG